MFEIIINALANQFGVDSTEINKDTKVREDLGADSLDIFEIVSAIEDETGLKLNPKELIGLRTVGEIEEYLNKQQNN